MSKVTYIFGAGASYGSRGVLPLSSQPVMSSDETEPETGIVRGLPILQEFPNAISQLKGELASITDFVAERKFLCSEVLNNILQISIEFPTIDTYAKLLYATKHYEEYEKFKEQLSLFFLIWQKYHKYDLRYDSFIASLIDAKTGQLPSMTILSWNYDMQLELSYANYITEGRTLWKIWDQLNVYCKSNRTLNYDDTYPFAFIKLNGAAMFHATKQDEHSLRYTLQDVLWSKVSEKYFWKDLCNIYDKGQHKNLWNVPEYKNELSYAWDDFGKEPMKSIINQRISDCEVVTVIGYSFPYVNREIDRHIFDNMPNLKHIYIQDKQAKGIAERVKAIFDFIKKPVPIIELKEDLSSFFIPNELG